MKISNEWLFYAYQSDWYEDTQLTRGCINLNNVVEFIEYEKHVEDYTAGDTIMCILARFSPDIKPFEVIIFKKFGTYDDTHEKYNDAWELLSKALNGVADCSVNNFFLEGIVNKS